MALVSARSAPHAEPVAEPHLDHQDPALRRRAAQRLGKTEGSEGVLCDRLKDEHDVSVRESILLALVALNSPEAATGLAQLLGSEDAGLRNGALESLAAMPEEASRILDRLYQSEDPDVRIFAVLLAGDLPHGWIQDWLIAALEAELEVNVCAAITEVLAEAGDHRAAPAVRDLTSRFPEEPFLHFVATTVLARLGSN